MNSVIDFPPVNHFSEDLLSDVQAFIEAYSREHLSSSYLFHSFEHTANCVKVCRKLAIASGLDKKRVQLVILATWFQHLKYIDVSDGGRETEDKHGVIVYTFLAEKGLSDAEIRKVETLISASDLNYVPTNEEEKIVHDAIWSFLGRKRFFRLAKLLRREKELVEGKEYNHYKWNKFLLNLLRKHQFYSLAAQKKYVERKSLNLDKQQEKTTLSKSKYRRQKSGKDFGRGIDTIYRNTLRGHLNLSAIADGKANMIISINALILSVLITVVTAGSSFTDIELYKNPRFIIPIMILMSGSLSAVIFAVLSVIPRSSKVDFSVDEVQELEVSLLFFNKFLKVEKDRFLDYLDGLKENQEKLYRNLGRDIYNLGTVLDKKYRLLSIAYKLFLGGLVLGFLSFAGFQIWG